MFVLNTKEDILKNEGNRAVFVSYYWSQWCKTAWLQTFFRISSFVFRTNIHTGLSKWWLTVHFWVYCLFKMSRVCAALTRYWHTKTRTKTARATLQTSRTRRNESSSSCSSSPPPSWDVFSAHSCPRSFMASSKRDRYFCRPLRGDAASSGTLPRDSDRLLEEQTSIPSRSRSRSSRGSGTLTAEHERETRLSEPYRNRYTYIHYIDKSIGTPSLEQKNALPNLWQQRWEHNSCI